MQITENQRQALAAIGRAILDGRALPEDAILRLPPSFLTPKGRLPITEKAQAYAYAAAVDWHFHYADDPSAFNKGRREAVLTREAIAIAGLRLDDVLEDLEVRL